MASKGHPNLAAEVIHPCSTTPGSARGFFSQVGQPGQVCCRGPAAGIQLLPKSPQPPSPRWTWTPPCPPHTLYSLIQGTSPKQASAVKAIARLVSPLTAFIQNQDQAFSSNSSSSIRSQGQGGCPSCDWDSHFHTTAFHLCSQGAFLSVSQTPPCPPF